MSLTQDIKDFALDIGYHHVGITSADSFTDHIKEVGSRGTIYDFYVEDPRQLLRGAEPKSIMPFLCKKKRLYSPILPQKVNFITGLR